VLLRCQKKLRAALGSRRVIAGRGKPPFSRGKDKGRVGEGGKEGIDQGGGVHRCEERKKREGKRRPSARLLLTRRGGESL